MEKNKTREINYREMNTAEQIADFYGFTPINSPTITKNDFDLTKSFDPDFNPEEKTALTKIYFEQKMMGAPQPSMFYCERPFHGSKNRKKPNKLEISLVSIGSYKSVCECISIQTAINILKEFGYKNISLDLNSIGDKESISEFQKKLNLYIKKNINSFPSDLRQLVKKDPLVILKSDKKDWEQFINDCPKSIDFLSESSRLYFKEVLEFLEIMNIPYSINNGLFADLNIGSETIFSIKEEKENLAFGFRFNRLAKRIGFKKDVPSSILDINIKIKKSLKKIKIKNKNPDFYLVQFGPEAKLRSFLILDQVYKSGAKLSHSIAKDKLGSQIGVAESSTAPYIILIGQKEALENSVVMRNNTNRSQEIVQIGDLASKIKSMKI